MSKIVSSVRKQLFNIIFWQLAIILGLALVIVLLQGVRNGFSALVGSLAYWLPTLLFIWRVSAHASARAAMRFMAVFMAGEVIKLVLSGILFILAAKFLAIDLLFGLIGLSGAIVAFWIASGVALTQQGVTT